MATWTMNKINFTVGAITKLTCPPGAQQAFLSDTAVPGLKVRVTAAGAKAYVFERKVDGKTVRLTIGAVTNWSIEQARAKARQIAVDIDSGVDPRASEKAAVVAATTVGGAWERYVADRKPYWGDRHHADHLKMTQPGGEKPKRGKVLTQSGILTPLLPLLLSDLTDERVEAWAVAEAGRRATQARLATRMLKAFLTWCTEQPDLRGLVPLGSAVAKTRRTRDALGRAGVKKDSLLREQLKPWFTAVRTMSNQTVAAYLQTCLITGARPNEALGLEWADIDWQWNSLHLRDKVEGDRLIPLTPYLGDLLWGLPRAGARVFATPKGLPISPPRKAHVAVCKVAGVPLVTFHGLRRSFKSLTEWLDIPTGVVAQIMGHKPSATAEKHYTTRPLDLLRVHHTAVEAWMLEQAGIEFKPMVERKLAVAK